MKDLTNGRFGKWVVIEPSDRINQKRQKYWICRCECGTVAIVRGDALRSGVSTACTLCSNLGRGRKTNIVVRGD